MSYLAKDNKDNKLKYHNETWVLIKRDLREHYGDEVYKNWFNELYFSSYVNSCVTLNVPTIFIKDLVSKNYLAIIQRLWKHYDSSVQIVDLCLNENNIKEIEIVPEIATRQSYAESNQNESIASSNLDQRFTFDNFIVGKSNELAYAASRAIAENYEAIPESNPLFLYGGVGLGKTHLMHAIAWHIRKTNPNRKVIYMSAEKFMYQFVKALRNKDVISFKEHFRSVDVLMIDDIQFICGKENTQEEFFHTFNALIDNNRQMVISCDRSPSDLDKIEDRVKSRLGWGLVADVYSTTYELRLSILQSKLELANKSAPKEVLEFLATKITSNVRELEGALNKVIAHANFTKSEISLQNTQEILRDLIRVNERNITIEMIQKKISVYYSIDLAELISTNKSRSLVRPRQIAMYISKLLTSNSLVEISRKFEKKDHTTIIHAIKKIEELYQQDSDFKSEIETLIKLFD
ncbi:MAG: chromosomal replication initiator protein DnaA [Rickettsiaceae bacterium]|nr:chromosomal replication initiator protein DnaA [Rickettsiaceae bacterium]